MTRIWTWVQRYESVISIIVYAALSLATAAAYPVMIRLLNVQTAWTGVAKTSGKFTVSIVALLVLWVWVVDRLAVRRKWSKSKSWAMSLLGVMILVIMAVS